MTRDNKIAYVLGIITGVAVFILISLISWLLIKW